MEENKDKSSIPMIKVNNDLSIYEYCASKQLTAEVNIEALFDIINVVDDLTFLEIIRDKKMVRDVILHKPKINEESIVFAMNNVLAFAKMKNNNEIDDKDLTMLRRVRLKKFFVEKKSEDSNRKE